MIECMMVAPSNNEESAGLVNKKNMTKVENDIGPFFTEILGEEMNLPLPVDNTDEMDIEEEAMLALPYLHPPLEFVESHLKLLYQSTPIKNSEEKAILLDIHDSQYSHEAPEKEALVTAPILIDERGAKTENQPNNDGTRPGFMFQDIGEEKINGSGLSEEVRLSPEDNTERFNLGQIDEDAPVKLGEPHDTATVPYLHRSNSSMYVEPGPVLESSAPQPVVEQIIENIVLKTDTGKTELTVKLKPDSFGSLTIKLTEQMGHTVAKIITDNQETRELIQGQILGLKSLLDEQGIRIQEVEVAYSGDNLLQDRHDRESGAFKNSGQNNSKNGGYKNNEYKSGRFKDVESIALVEHSLDGGVNYLI